MWSDASSFSHSQFCVAGRRFLVVTCCKNNLVFRARLLKFWIFCCVSSCTQE